MDGLQVDLSEPLAHARITVTVQDADISYGQATAHDRALPAGTTVISAVHVPLSARVMSGVDERRSAECSITLEDLSGNRVLARVDEAVDIQPRDLWLWKGDPRRSEQRVRLLRRGEELQRLLEGEPADAEATRARDELLRLKTTAR